jgi:hypothetical protein
MMEGGCEKCGGWEWDNELEVGVVWKEALESTTQSIAGGGGEGTVCVERARGGAPIEPLRGEGDNEVSIAREATTAGGWGGEDNRSRHVTTRLGKDLNADTKNRVHGSIKGYKNALDKLVVVKEDGLSDPSRTWWSQKEVGAGSQSDSGAIGARNNGSSGRHMNRKGCSHRSRAKDAGGRDGRQKAEWRGPEGGGGGVHGGGGKHACAGRTQWLQQLAEGQRGGVGA